MLLAEALVLGTAASLLALFVTGLTLDSMAPLVQQQLGRAAPAVSRRSPSIRVSSSSSSAPAF